MRDGRPSVNGSSLAIHLLKLYRFIRIKSETRDFSRAEKYEIGFRSCSPVNWLTDVICFERFCDGSFPVRFELYSDCVSEMASYEFCYLWRGR